MPIAEIFANEIVQQCAACNATRRLDARELQAEEPAAILALPPCTCGAVESLIHSPEGEPPHPMPGSFGHHHRVIVDALLDVLSDGADDTRSLEARVLAKVPSDVKAHLADVLKLRVAETARSERGPKKGAAS